jgi:hypothetical protein
MEEKEVLSKKDNILLLLSLVSIIIYSVLIFKFHLLSLALTTIMILVTSTIISLIVKRSFNKDLLIEIKEVLYILTFSLLPTLIFAIILPYMLFRNNFFSIYTIILAYVLPTLFVFFILLHIFDYVIKNKPVRYGYMTLVSLIIAVVITTLFLVATAFSTDYIHGEKSKVFYEDYKVLEFESTDYSDLKIFNEIEEFQNTMLNGAEEENTEFISYDINNNFCYTNNCITNVFDKGFNIVELVIRVVVTNGILEIANEELKHINSEEYLENFTSLEEYESHLIAGVNTVQPQFGLSEESQELRSLTESDFSYKDYKEKIENDGRFQSFSGITQTFVFGEDNSIFLESLSHTVKHTTLFKEFIKFVVNISIYFEDKQENHELIMLIYENKGVEESLESSVIRNKILHYYLVEGY